LALRFVLRAKHGGNIGWAGVGGGITKPDLALEIHVESSYIVRGCVAALSFSILFVQKCAKVI
jgi:hypothetical protein